jgi:hypothetical protein
VGGLVIFSMIFFCMHLVKRAMTSKDPASVVFLDSDPASSMITVSPLYGMVICESRYIDFAKDWPLLTTLSLRSIQTQCTGEINTELLFERVGISSYRAK